MHRMVSLRSPENAVVSCMDLELSRETTASVVEDRQVKLAEAAGRRGCHIDDLLRLLVKAMTAISLPSGSHDATPAAPFTSTDYTKSVIRK